MVWNEWIDQLTKKLDSLKYIDPFLIQIVVLLVHFHYLTGLFSGFIYSLFLVVLRL